MWVFKHCIFAFACAKVTMRNTGFASSSFLNRDIHGDDILNKFSSRYCNDVCLAIPWELQLALALINSVQFSCIINIFYILCWIWINPWQWKIFQHRNFQNAFQIQQSMQQRKTISWKYQHVRWNFQFMICTYVSWLVMWNHKTNWMPQ